jgi:hypothetical protein
MQEKMAYPKGLKPSIVGDWGGPRLKPWVT